ncbi:MAG: hypothetical protein U0575_16415 [Phycisphaerales bacterium]
MSGLDHHLPQTGQGATGEPAPPTAAPPSRAGASIFGGTAFVLAALIIMKAGDLPAHEAYAGTATTGSGFTMVTASNGYGKETRPHEMLFLVDNRSELLYVYEIEDVSQRRVILRGGASLPTLLRAGRGR